MNPATQSVASFIPPTPPLPEVGRDWKRFGRRLRGNILSTWPKEAYEEPVWRGQLLHRQVLLLNDPDAIHYVMVENVENYRRSPASIRILWPIVGKGLLLAEGGAWRHQRRTLAPAFAPRATPIICHHIVRQTQEVLPDLLQKEGIPVDLLAFFQQLTLEIAGRALFSLETHAFGTQLRSMMAYYGMALSRPSLLDLLFPIGIPSPRDILRWRFRKQWLGLIDRILDDRLALPKENAPRDLLDFMLAAKDPETGASFTRAMLRDELATLIVAGHETTAVALFWTLFLIAHLPEEQDKIFEEVRNIRFEPNKAAEILPILTRCRAVVSEALRLYPPAPVLVRQAIADDHAGRIAIAAGTLVFIAPWILHRHHRLWQNPNAFDPSRFFPTAPPAPRFAYLPFGAGPRVCIGAQFALAEATLVLGMLLQLFTIKRSSNEPVIPVSIVTMQPDHPPCFFLQPRLFAERTRAA
ncbi:MAG: cytochrome P450 [Acetobacteraceae bacterium]|nr:cytochrome P450 [Acetobacteraceae bacterium]